MLPEAPIVPGGLLPALPNIMPLRSISPSSFSQLQQCPLRSVASATKIALLPGPPQAALGNIIHSLLEKAGLGRLKSRSEIERAFDSAVAREEAQLAETWYERQLIPFLRSIRDFQVRRNKALDLVDSVAARAGKSEIGGSTVLTLYERACETNDHLIRGRIDAIVETPDSVTIRDYKTGPVFRYDQDVAMVSPDYVTQLSMYAAIYRENGELRPVDLELVTAGGDIVPVSYDMSDSLDLLRAARVALTETNNVIAALGPTFSSQLMSELAKPSADTCAFCSFRPACRPYRESVWDDQEHRDVLGRIKERKIMGNGTVALDIALTEGKVARVRQLKNDIERHPALQFAEAGDEVGVFNVRSSNGAMTFVETTMTTIYKM